MRSRRRSRRRPSPSLVLERRELLPAAPGVYAWWSRRDAIPRVPHASHPLDDELSLLYVGISPVREASRQTIRSRVFGNHLNGNVGSSTFRFIPHGNSRRQPVHAGKTARCMAGRDDRRSRL